MPRPSCLRAYGLRCNAPLDCHRYACPRLVEVTRPADPKTGPSAR